MSLVIDPEVEEFIEHFGKKGMKWGTRKVGQAGKSTGTFVKKHKKGIAISAAAATALGASYAAGRLAGGKGKIPITEMNSKASKLVRAIGLNYSNGILKSNDKASLEVITNTARQVKEGLLLKG